MRGICRSSSTCTESKEHKEGKYLGRHCCYDVASVLSMLLVGLNNMDDGLPIDLGGIYTHVGYVVVLDVFWLFPYQYDKLEMTWYLVGFGNLVFTLLGYTLYVSKTIGFLLLAFPHG